MFFLRVIVSAILKLKVSVGFGCLKPSNHWIRIDLMKNKKQKCFGLLFKFSFRAYIPEGRQKRMECSS